MWFKNSSTLHNIKAEEKKDTILQLQIMNLRRPADFDSVIVKTTKFVYILKFGANERYPRCRKTIPSGWAIF